jgi:hypothetical protein
LPVRGDAALTARLLLRATGLAGLLAAGGGGLAIVGAFGPWYRAVAIVEMLGSEDGRTIATVGGLPEVWPAWAAWPVAALGMVAVVLGLAIAFDRPPHWARWALAAVAVGLLGCAALAAWRVPAVDAVVAGAGPELQALAARLPTGVELEVTTTVAAGVWRAAVAAVMVGVGAAGTRDV